MFKLKNKKLLLLMVFMLMAMMVFTACKSEVGSQETPMDTDKEETAQEATWTIVIETSEGKDVDFTDLDLEEMGKTKLKATTKKKDDIGIAQENEWTGVQLNKILKFAGIEEFDSVEIEAGDGFSAEYTKEMANSDKTILAVEKNGNALDEKSAPARMVVKDEGAEFWIKNVAKIKVKK